MRNHSGRQRTGNPYATGVALDLLNRFLQLPYKPPFTCFLIALNACIHLYPAALAGVLPARLLFGDYTKVCLKPAKVVKELLNGEVDAVRLFGSALIHGDDLHLWYNMGSLLMKGVSLETTMGTPAFALLVVFLWALSHTLVVVVALASVYLGFDPGFNSCMVGFSAVLFALKYVAAFREPARPTPVGYFLIDSRWASWAELILIQVVVPNASFLGHLCGILAGVLWVHGGAVVAYTAKTLAPLGVGRGGPGAYDTYGGRGSRYTYARGTSGTAAAGSAATSTSPVARPPAFAPGAASDSAAFEVEDADAQLQEALRRSLEEVRLGGAAGAEDQDWVHLRRQGR
ncbi:hypothetical protein JKP88DRAFT_309038 [Tribonema minus]|uniref:Peptidase S54 rhomboid domain-containing protein n=1 Tax=Tribonema minus TaxID=303371 RepID=A0A836CHG7_9STRA|nr:hypothetical protein JKP88DRAFT_309038 [Tribonema minus]